MNFEKIRNLFCILSLFFCLYGNCKDKIGIVTANKLNVRARPGISYTAVAQLTKGSKVVIIGKKDKWLKIKAPEDATAWIPAKTVTTNNTIAYDTPVYSGPAISYNTLGILKVNEKVKIIKKNPNGWLRIKTPEHSTAWVHSDYIYIIPEEVKKKKKDTTEIISKNKKSQSPLLPPPGDISSEYILSLLLHTIHPDIEPLLSPLPYLKKIKIPKNANFVTLTGFLLPLEDDAVYVTSAICIPIGKDYFPICYLRSDRYLLYTSNKTSIKTDSSIPRFSFTELPINLWTGAKLRVTGLLRWVNCWQRPVLEVYAISFLPY